MIFSCHLELRKIKFSSFELSNEPVIRSLLGSIKSNPYKSYKYFHEEVRYLIMDNYKSFSDLHEFYEYLLSQRQEKKIVARIKNCPIDKDVPIFDFHDPVSDKYRVKKTFVGEAFLEAVSIILDIPILSYTTRNNGDVFQDVYAQDKFMDTQTQKADVDLFFHNDRTAHLVRADVLCLLGMRSDPDNIINTGYVDGEDILEKISLPLQETLRERYFFTPFDEVSKFSNKNQVKSEKHAILIESSSFRYYDTRTTVAEDAPEIAWKALVAVKDAIIKAEKLRVSIQEGDLFIFPNLQGLHNREKIYVPKINEAKERYLLKTYNFWSPERRNRFQEFYVDNFPGHVDDDKVDIFYAN